MAKYRSFPDFLLNNKIIILLNLAEYLLFLFLFVVVVCLFFQTIFRAISQVNCS